MQNYVLCESSYQVTHEAWNISALRAWNVW